jgi:hypothetical protein
MEKHAHRGKEKDKKGEKETKPRQEIEKQSNIRR